MTTNKYLILGAGPAGLSFAHRLLQMGEKNFIILEANNEAGGLCRSLKVDGSIIDVVVLKTVELAIKLADELIAR